MFQYIGFAIRYLPIVIAAVQMVEGMVSKDTSGEAKKELATAFVLDAVQGFGVTINPRLEEIVGQVIDLAVNILNFFGIFISRAEITDEEEITIIVKDEAEAKAKVVTEARTENAARMDELEEVLRQ